VVFKVVCVCVFLELWFEANAKLAKRRSLVVSDVFFLDVLERAQCISHVNSPE